MSVNAACACKMTRGPIKVVCHLLTSSESPIDYYDQIRSIWVVGLQLDLFINDDGWCSATSPRFCCEGLSCTVCCTEFVGVIKKPARQALFFLGSQRKMKVATY